VTNGSSLPSSTTDEATAAPPIWSPLTRMAFRFSVVYFGLYCVLHIQIPFMTLKPEEPADRRRRPRHWSSAARSRPGVTTICGRHGTQHEGTSPGPDGIGIPYERVASCCTYIPYRILLWW
jgi:hypothetical protein